MKIYFKHPDGFEFKYTSQPMDLEKFKSLLCLLAAALAAAVLITLITTVGR